MQIYVGETTIQGFKSCNTSHPIMLYQKSKTALIINELHIQRIESQIIIEDSLIYINPRKSFNRSGFTPTA